MRSVREILRLRLDCKLSSREVAGSCGVHRKTVGEYEKRILLAGLSWDDIKDMDDDALKRLVRSNLDQCKLQRPLPDADYIAKELKRPHVTRRTLWLEYKAEHPDGYEYSQFCFHLGKYLADPDLSMHIEYKAGERMFTDYAGDTVPITDPKTGEVRPAYIFVSCLGASSLIYTEGTESMKEACWIDSHIHAMEYYGGASEIIIPDNTKTAVKTPDRYEPDINPLFHDMADHYGCAVIPARVAKPRDKARVEKAVQTVETMILGPLRNRVFFSVHELNAALWEALDKVNSKKMQKLEVSRRDLFEEVEKAALKPLPATRYAFREWATLIVIRDRYTDKVEYQTVVTTDLEANAQQIHRWIRSRWDIEETFMTESRYGCLNRIGSCRESVAGAIVHFSLLAYTLLRLFGRQEESDRKDMRPRLPTARVEFVAYWRGYYAIIFPSQLIELVARCAPAWGERLPAILEKLRTVERPP